MDVFEKLFPGVSRFFGSVWCLELCLRLRRGGFELACKFTSQHRFQRFGGQEDINPQCAHASLTLLQPVPANRQPLYTVRKPLNSNYLIRFWKKISSSATTYYPPPLKILPIHGPHLKEHPDELEDDTPEYSEPDND